MNYDNNDTNKKLQELENQSLPDLSKMDEHWQQMGSLLQPAVPVKKTVWGKRLLFGLSAVVLVIISFFLLRQSHPTGSESITHRETETLPAANTTVIPIDSVPAKPDTMILKARTSDGRDTIIKAVPVEAPSRQSNKVLLEKFYTEVQKKPQRFQINNRRDTILYGKEGTSLYIPANSFDVNETVHVLLTEYYSIDDMIMKKLTTTCGGKRLVTGGMVYVDARTKNDELVDLKKGASLRLDMPKEDNQQPMQLFYGNDYYRNDFTEVLDSIDWRPANQVFTDAKPKSFDVLKDEKGFYDKTVEVDALSIYKKDNPIAYLDGDTLRVASNNARRRVDNTIKTDSLFKDVNVDLDELAVQRFGVNITQLGWINCDRFFNDPRPRVDLIVDLGDNPDNYSTMVVFKGPASVLNYTHRTGNILRFQNLPQGESVRIVSLGIRNSKPVTAMQQVTISKTPVTNLNFEEITASAFKKKLSTGNYSK